MEVWADMHNGGAHIQTRRQSSPDRAAVAHQPDNLRTSMPVARFNYTSADGSKTSFMPTLIDTGAGPNVMTDAVARSLGLKLEDRNMVIR